MNLDGFLIINEESFYLRSLWKNWIKHMTHTIQNETLVFYKPYHNSCILWYCPPKIHQIIYEKPRKSFYMITNKQKGLLGFFVLKLPSHNVRQVTWLMRYLNKLDIGDTNIFINHRSVTSRELVISFKTIYINTYNIYVLDITSDDSKTLLYRHESF